MFVCRFAAFGQMSATSSEESHIERYVCFVFLQNISRCYEVYIICYEVLAVL